MCAADASWPLQACGRSVGRARSNVMTAVTFAAWCECAPFALKIHQRSARQARAGGVQSTLSWSLPFMPSITLAAMERHHADLTRRAPSSPQARAYGQNGPRYPVPQSKSCSSHFGIDPRSRTRRMIRVQSASDSRSTCVEATRPLPESLMSASTFPVCAALLRKP